MAHELIPGLEGIPIAESGVSFVDGAKGRLEYRGISIEDLAEHATFEEVSFLLMYGHQPSQSELDEFKGLLTTHRRLKFRIVDLIKCLPETGHPMDALQAGVAAMGMFYPQRHNMDPEATRSACIRLISKLPTVVAAFDRLRKGDEHIRPRDDLSLAGSFLHMLNGREPDPQKVRLLDICLILHADHTMNASTFAGRVVGSTMADPYSVISSALGALSGPLHGGANEDVMSLLDRIGSPSKARSVVEKMIAEKTKIPGFGHRVYKAMDPRASILKKHAKKLADTGCSNSFEIAEVVEEVVREHYAEKGIWPNVDFFSGIVYSELGIPRDCFTPVFAMARVSGWLAHWLEQMKNNRIFRPTQKYVGLHDVPLTPLAKR